MCDLKAQLTIVVVKVNSESYIICRLYNLMKDACTLVIIYAGQISSVIHPNKLDTLWVIQSDRFTQMIKYLC